MKFPSPSFTIRGSKPAKNLIKITFYSIQPRGRTANDVAACTPIVIETKSVLGTIEGRVAGNCGEGGIEEFGATGAVAIFTATWSLWSKQEGTSKSLCGASDGLESGIAV
jgi:hypothetical protein